MCSSDLWNKVNTLRMHLAKDGIDEKGLFTQITVALAQNDYAKASELQVEMLTKMDELKSLYDAYVKNMI